MPRNTSVSLGDHFTTFIDTEVKSGRYGSASEVVRAGLRLLQEHEAKVKALKLDAVNAALRKYLDPAKLVVIKAGDFAKDAKK